MSNQDKTQTSSSVPMIVGTLCGIFAIFIWATPPTIYSAATDIDAFLVITIEYFAGFLIFAGRWLVKRENPLADIKSVPWWFYAITFGGMGVHDITWVLAIQNAPSEEAALIIYQWPILLVLFTAITLKKKLGVLQLLACALGALGIYILLSGKGLSLHEFELVSGHIYAGISAVTWAVFSAVAARHNHLSDNLLSVNFLVVSIVCLFVWLFAHDAVMPSEKSFIIVLVASLFIGLSYIMWNYAMKHGNAQLLGFFSFSIPILATILLVMFGITELSQTLVIAMLLILVGIGLASYADKRLKRRGVADNAETAIKSSQNGQ